VGTGRHVPFGMSRAWPAGARRWRTLAVSRGRCRGAGCRRL